MDVVLQWTWYCSGRGIAVDVVLQWTWYYSGRGIAVDLQWTWYCSGCGIAVDANGMVDEILMTIVVKMSRRRERETDRE